MENHPDFFNHQESGVYGQPSRIFKPSRIRRIWKTIQNCLTIKNQAYMENHPEFLNHQESGVYGKPSRIINHQESGVYGQPSRIFKPPRIRRIWKTIQNFLTIKNQAHMEKHQEFLDHQESGAYGKPSIFLNHQESGVYGQPSRMSKPSRIRRIWKTINFF